MRVVGVSPLMHGSRQSHHLSVRSGVARTAGRDSKSRDPHLWRDWRSASQPIGTVAVGEGPEREEGLCGFRGLVTVIAGIGRFGEVGS